MTHGDLLPIDADARLAMAETPFSLYLHIPFCEKKCPYCDFNTYAGMQDIHQATVDALCGEMARWKPLLGKRAVQTIFVGGGTPTVLSAAQLEQLVGALHANFDVAPDCEFTSEANPGTVDRAKFGVLRRLGVNRLSLGVQSFDPDELAFLGRIHDVADVYRAVDDARDAGFDNLNLDFIFGLPKQEPEKWERTLDAALAVGTEHLSLYSLIVEENTPLFHWVETGRVEEPDEDLAAQLYERAMDRLGGAGYAHYEISNWARRTANESANRRRQTLPRLASRHNLVYWQNGEYLGIGPGAHSHLRLRDGTGASASHRWGNRKPVPSYVRRVNDNQPLHEFHETLDAPTAMAESMMLGLRLIDDGVSLERFRSLHGATLENVYAPLLAELAGDGLIELLADRVRLTERGKMVGNQIFLRFLPDDAPVSILDAQAATPEGIPA